MMQAPTAKAQFLTAISSSSETRRPKPPAIPDYLSDKCHRKLLRQNGRFIRTDLADEITGQAR
jgi:hypothetical protein